MSHQIALFPEKPTRSITEFEFIQDPKDKNSRLGVGSFATVKLAREKKHNKLIALKMVDLETSKSRTADLHNLRTEVHIHRRIDHPNIIKYHGYTQEGYCIYIVLDYAEKGNLYSYIHKRKFLSPQEIFRFFYQTCLAVQYLHKQDVMHRDLKPENLLLDKDLNIKICDFGWATERVKEKRTTFCGTYEYMAPEIVHKRPYDYHIDIWSLGILLYELIHREAPYKGRSLPEIHNSLSKGTITYNPTCDPQARDLIQRILKINPGDRPSISQILSHPFVKQHLVAEPVKEILSSGHKTSKHHDKTDRKVDKENISERMLLASERPLTSMEHAPKKVRKPSGWQPASPHHSEIRRRPQEEQQRSEISGRTHTKSSSSLSKMVLETLDSEDKRMLPHDINRARKITELKGLSPTLKRSLQSIVSPPNHVTPPEQALSEVFTTKNVETPNNISTLLENFASYGTAGPLSGQQTTAIPSYNNLSSMDRGGTTNITANSATSITAHIPIIVDQSRAGAPSKKLRTLTTSHTPSNSRLFCSPTTPHAGSTAATTATTRAPSHQKALTVISENDLPRRVFTENQTCTAASNRVVYKGNRFIISPRVLETSVSTHEPTPELPRTLSSLVSPVGWTRRKLITAKSTTEANMDEDALRPINGNVMSEKVEYDQGEDKEAFGINFNRFVKGEYRPKTVAKGAEGSRVRIMGVKKVKVNKENKAEGEKKIKRLMSLERLYTPRDVRFQFINL